MASRWDGKINRLKAWSKKTESKSTSFIVPKSKEPHPDTCEFEEGREAIPSIDDIITGTTRQFDPQEEYNFKSAYKRYLKALELRPSKIKAEGNKTTYFYYSCESNTGFWEVTVGEEDDGTFINLLIPSLTIVCPPSAGFKLNGVVESDGTVFKWEQRSGNRTVLFDDDSIANPTIFIESTCYTSGCDDGTGLPIVLRVSLASNPLIFQDLVIYNTLTSTYFGNSVSGGITSNRACQKITFIPAPRFTEKAYCGDESNPILVTWNPPSCDSEFVIAYELIVNTTGNYVLADSIDINEEKLFELEFNKHYKIVSVFNFYGKIVRTPSDIIYLSTGGIQHFLFGDDNFSSGLSTNKLIDNYSKINLKVATYEYEDEYDSLFSTSKLNFNYSKVDLKVATYEYKDEYTSQIATSKLTSSYTKVNLEGVVIG